MDYDFRESRLYKIIFYLWIRFNLTELFYNVKLNPYSLTKVLVDSTSPDHYHPSDFEKRFVSSIYNQCNKDQTEFLNLFEKKDILFLREIINRIRIINNNNYRIRKSLIFTKRELFEFKNLLTKIRNHTKYDLYGNTIKYQHYIVRNPNSLFYLALRGGFNRLHKFNKRLHGGVFIDGGAYTGESSILLNYMFNPKRIYAFEPDVTKFNTLKVNLKNNHISNCIITQKGLGRRKGKIFLEPQGNGASYITKQPTKYSNEINIDKIDNLFKENVDLIKLDVEDSEYDAIKGATKIIIKYKPVLFIAMYHSGKNFFEVPKLIRKIRSDYKYNVFKQFPYSPFADTTLIAF